MPSNTTIEAIAVCMGQVGMRGDKNGHGYVLMCEQECAREARSCMSSTLTAVLVSKNGVHVCLLECMWGVHDGEITGETTSCGVW